MRTAQRAALAAFLVLAGVGELQARPFEVEDLVRQEALGDVTLTRDEHWLVLARRGSAATGPRFDLGPYSADFRTRLLVADLTAEGAVRPLFPQAAGFGYRLGPLSPNGRQMAVWRVSPAGLELGITLVGSGGVRWLGVSTEAPAAGRTVLWLDDRELLAIGLPDGATPYDLFARRPQAASPALWARSAKGEASVTAIGSGVFQTMRPPRPAKRLLRIDGASGEVIDLASGDFTDLELSPSGRWLAALEAGPEIPLSAARPPQKDYGTAVRETRLLVTDLRTGRAWSPCPRCDVLSNLLSWSRSDRLLTYARASGQPWTAGALMITSPGTKAVTEVRTSVRPQITGRPERVWAGWWGDEPLAFGRPPGTNRDDWYRLASRGAVRLTGAFAAPPRRELVITSAGPLVAADGGAWRLDRQGPPHRLSPEPFTPRPSRIEGLPTRADAQIGPGESLEGRLGVGAAARMVRLSTGATQGGAPAGDGTALAIGRSGAALMLTSGGGRQRVLWRTAAGRDLPILDLNDHRLDLDRPVAHPVAHPGPRGEALTSWLFLPVRATGRPPPLVIVPYPGSVRRTAPDSWDGDPMNPTAVLLGRGYAVLIPSLPDPAAPEGPGAGLGPRLLAIVDGAARQPDLAGRFDASAPALWGHSFGGWGALMAVSQTDGFSAAVVTAARTDFASAYGQFSPWTRLRPEDGLSVPWNAGWTESLQGGMSAPPWEAPARYADNSPVFQAGRIHTPVLMAAGELDGAHLAQAEEMFSALYRQGKDAVLLSYWGENHGFTSPGNIRDLYARALEFLERQRPVRLKDGVAAGRPESGSANSAPRTPPHRP